MADGDVTKTDNVRIDVSGQEKAQRKNRMGMAEYDAKEMDNLIQKGEKWARVQKKMAEGSEDLAKELSKESAALGALKNNLGKVMKAGQDYIKTLSDMASVGAVYRRSLEEMQKGTQTFTGSLNATTDAIGAASAKSTAYIHAVRDSYAQADRLQAEFKVSADAVRQATDQLTERFGTQIGAMGGVSASLKGMQRDAVIYSRYMGTDMNDVMEMWQNRLEQTNMTMEQVQQETALLSHESDEYSKALKSLGKDMLKTGHIGRKELLKMVRDVGKEMQGGTYNAVAYAKALGGLLVQAKKGQRTTEEQRKIQEGLSGMMKSMFSVEGDLSVFGHQAASQIMATWDDLSNIQDEQLRKRIAQVRDDSRKLGLGDVQKRMALMDVLRGSAAGTALGLRNVSQRMSSQLGVEQAAQFTGGNRFAAMSLIKRMQSGELIKDFEAQAAKDKEKKEEEALTYKSGIEDLVKAGADPKLGIYKAVDVLEKIHASLTSWIKENPVKALLIKTAAGFAAEVVAMQIQTAQIVAAINTSALTNAAGGGPLGFLGGGGGLLGLLGKGLAGAGIAYGMYKMLEDTGGPEAGILSGLGGLTGSMLPAPIGLAGAAGLAVGHHGLRKGQYSLGEGLRSGETERILGKEGGDLSAMMAYGYGRLSGQISEEQQQETVRIRAGEYQRRKKELVLMDEEISRLQKMHDKAKDLDKAEIQERIMMLQLKRKDYRDSVSYRDERQRLEVKELKEKEKMLRPEKIAQAFGFGAAEELLGTVDETLQSPQKMLAHVLERGNFTMQDFASADFEEKMMAEAGKVLSGERLAAFGEELKKHLKLQGAYAYGDQEQVGAVLAGGAMARQAAGGFAALTPAQKGRLSPALVGAAAGAARGVDVTISGDTGESVPVRSQINAKGEREEIQQTMVAVNMKRRVDARQQVAQNMALQNKLTDDGSLG